jgi:hypothetical protein
MENIGHIEIVVSGAKGNIPLSVDNYDIRDVKSILENTENLLFPGDKKNRPVISYQIQEGSVKHIFKTSIQYVIGFNALLAEISHSKQLDFLELKTAEAFESFQEMATKNNYEYTLKTSLHQSQELKIDRSTKYYRSEAIWTDAEFYFYGKVTNAGGKDRANLHLYTQDLGTIRIETPMEFLEAKEDNILYRNFGVRVKGKQHSQTGEVDKSSLKFIELIDYQSKFDADYLNSLINKATDTWSSINDKDNWLKEIRGGYE